MKPENGSIACIPNRNEQGRVARFPHNLDARDRREIVPVPDMSLLSSQPRKDAKESGAYYTPGDVAEALVRWAVREDTDTLLDPSCGDGRFIARHANSVGVERDGAAAEAARQRAPRAELHERDFFSWAEWTTQRFDCAAGNPPFIRYQMFNGAVRRRALNLCAEAGAPFSSLTASWAPFLVVTASLLRSGGRMAFVVPASIGHAPYATPLIEYLIARFDLVRIVAIRRKLFPRLSEDCWLLFAEGFGGSTDVIHFEPIEHFGEFQFRGSAQIVPANEWRQAWNRRLRPYLLSTVERSMYREVAQRPDSSRLGLAASVGIGYVSGANEFFHLRPSEAAHWNIPEQFLHPTVRNGRVLPARVLSPRTIEEWRRSDQPMLLLRIPREVKPPAPVIAYPTLVFGYFFLIRANREGGQVARTDVVIDSQGNPVEGVVRFHQALCAMTGRLGVRDDASRYEAIAMALVEVSPGNPGEVTSDFPPDDSTVHFDPFFSTMYRRYDERYVVSVPLLAERTRRLEWAPDSPAFDAPPFRLLDYDLRIRG